MDVKKYNNEFLLEAHTHSSSHKNQVLKSDTCGCFYCQQIINTSEIEEWIEEASGEETAICPKCDVDAILSSDLPINDKQFLKEMNEFWFEH